VTETAEAAADEVNEEIDDARQENEQTESDESGIINWFRNLFN
jgi:hypothetical protein